VFRSLCLSLPFLDFHDQESLRQLHQFFFSYVIVEGLLADFSVSVQTLKQKIGPSCQSVFVGIPVYPSSSHQQVNNTLRGIHLSVEDEFRFPKSCHSVDMRVHHNAMRSTGTVSGWVVEFDGTLHFLTCRMPVGGTLMKRRQLELLGYNVVRFPFWEWDQLERSDERKEYLRGKLHIS
jgi:hypothetical protein